MPYKDPEKQKRAQRESHERHRERRRIAQKSRRQEFREWVKSLKENKPCADCGQSFHWAAMQFDHLPGTEKLASIRDLANRYQSKRLIEEEITKCELVCANCHAVRTFERLGGEEMMDDPKPPYETKLPPIETK